MPHSISSRLDIVGCRECERLQNARLGHIRRWAELMKVREHPTAQTALKAVEVDLKESWNRLQEHRREHRRERTRDIDSVYEASNLGGDAVDTI
jgi:hypothetical protein